MSIEPNQPNPAPHNPNESINIFQESDDNLSSSKAPTYLETPHFPRDTDRKSSCSFFFKDIDSKDEISRFGDKAQGDKERHRSFHNPKTKSFDAQMTTNILSRELFEKRKSVFEASPSNTQSISSFIKKGKDANSNTASSSLISEILNPIRINCNAKGSDGAEEDKSLLEQVNIVNSCFKAQSGRGNKGNEFKVVRQGEIDVSDAVEEEGCCVKEEGCCVKEVIELRNDREGDRFCSYVNDNRLKRETILNVIIIGRQGVNTQRTFRDIVPRTSSESCNLSFNREHLDKKPVTGKLNEDNALKTFDIRKTLKRSKEKHRLSSIEEPQQPIANDLPSLNVQIDYSKLTAKKKGKDLKDYNVFINNPTPNDQPLSGNQPPEDKADDSLFQTNLMTYQNESEESNIAEPKKTSLSRNSSSYQDNSNDNTDHIANANKKNDYCIMLPQNNDNGLVTFKAEQLEKIFTAVNKQKEQAQIPNTSRRTNKTPIPSIKAKSKPLTKANARTNNTATSHSNSKKQAVQLQSKYQPIQKAKSKRQSYEKVIKPHILPIHLKPQQNSKKPTSNSKSSSKVNNYLINQFDGNPIYAYNKEDQKSNLSAYSPLKTMRNESEQSFYQLLIEIQRKCIDNTASFKQKESELKNEIDCLKERINSFAKKELVYQNEIKQLSIKQNLMSGRTKTKAFKAAEESDIEKKLNMIKANQQYSKVLNDNQSLKELFDYFFEAIGKIKRTKPNS